MICVFSGRSAKGNAISSHDMLEIDSVGVRCYQQQTLSLDFTRAIDPFRPSKAMQHPVARHSQHSCFLSQLALPC
jgi:hypothetical protein